MVAKDQVLSKHAVRGSLPARTMCLIPITACFVMSVFNGTMLARGSGQRGSSLEYLRETFVSLQIGGRSGLLHTLPRLAVHQLPYFTKLTGDDSVSVRLNGRTADGNLRAEHRRHDDCA